VKVSGKGGTAARGHKGAKSRSGYSKKIGFEGGQMPLQRRVPKFGFKNINRKEYAGVNLDTLQALVDNGIVTDTVDFAVLVDNRLATKNEQVKILGRGELKAKLKVTAHKFTATAKAAIEAAGGEVVSL
jgi:large subunit ribosomal protein L15